MDWCHISGIYAYARATPGMQMQSNKLGKNCDPPEYFAFQGASRDGQRCKRLKRPGCGGSLLPYTNIQNEHRPLRGSCGCVRDGGRPYQPAMMSMPGCAYRSCGMLGCGLCGCSRQKRRVELRNHTERQAALNPAAPPLVWIVHIHFQFDVENRRAPRQPPANCRAGGLGGRPCVEAVLLKPQG